jgi:ActR/RegA family two-component response regulator
MKHLLVIEDGNEYAEFARLFLAAHFHIVVAQRAADALACLRSEPVDVLLIDLRFDRAVEADLVGDVQATASRLFAGDRERALRHVQDQQGVLILAQLRAAGCSQRAVFIHEFLPRRMENLRRLYGPIFALSTFDCAALLRALGEED